MRRFARPVFLALGAAVLFPLPAAPSLAHEAPLSERSSLRAQIAARAEGDVRDFYAARDYRPLWIDEKSESLSPAATDLTNQIAEARLDELKPRKLKTGNLWKALAKAEAGAPEALAKAELALSRSYALYVQALRRVEPGDTIYESEALMPVVPTERAALQSAAAAGSLDRYVSAMEWMHPLYAPMRAALADPHLDGGRRALIARNLQRVRALPAGTAGRYVLVDAAGARLWMYDGGKPIGSMRVVVGKTEHPTPMIAGFIRYAIVNPYWNVPEDLVRTNIAANTVAKGTGYLKTGRYQVLSSWSEDAETIDPAHIDWAAIQAGTQAPPRVRQLPGSRNFMGNVKFMFPNEQGIYLHDTPDKDLLREDARQFSSGCVRLEDAGRLGRWLLGKPLPANVRQPEQRIALPEVVPVYITYLTAMPEKNGIAFRSDIYGRDTTSRKGVAKIAVRN